MHSRKFIKTAACMFLALSILSAGVPVRTFADEQGSSAEVLYDEGGSATTASSENTGSSTGTADDSSADLLADSGAGTVSTDPITESSAQTYSTETISSADGVNTDMSAASATQSDSSADMSSASGTRTDSSTVPTEAAAAVSAEQQDAALAGAQGADAGINSGLYYISTKNDDNVVLDVSNASMDNFANVQLYRKNSGLGQVFRIIPLENGLYEIQDYNSDKMLDVAGGSTLNRANVQQYEANNSAAQKWYITASKETGYVTIVSSASGKVLDADGGAFSNGTNVQIYSSNDSAAQQWKVTPVGNDILTQASRLMAAGLSDGWYTIHMKNEPGKTLDISGGSLDDGGNVQVYSANNSDTQIFGVSSLGNGLYSIRSFSSGKVIDLSGGCIDKGTNIQQYGWNESQAQKWYIEQDSATGAYTISSSLCSRRVLETAGGSTADGANVQLYDFNAGYGQYWSFEPVEEAAVHRISDGIYTIASSIDNSKVLDVDSASFDNGANIQLYKSNGTNAQKFMVRCIDRSTYTYSITNVNSRKSIDVYNGLSANGTNVQQYGWNGSAAQRWQIIYSNGSYLIRSSCGGLCLDLEDGQALNCKNIQIYESNNSKAQRWEFISTQAKAPAARLYTIESAADISEVIDVLGADWHSFANIQLFSSNGTNAQKFYLYINGDGTYSMLNCATGKMMDVRGGSREAGANVQQYASNGTAAQKWRFEPTGDADGSYYIISAASGLALDLEGGVISDSTNVQIWNLNYSKAQKFIMQPVSASNGWLTDISGNRSYQTGSGLLKGWNKIDGNWYYFDGNGILKTNCIIDNYNVNADGVRTGATIPSLAQNSSVSLSAGSKTLTGLLANAMVPCGRTLYIWGGTGTDDTEDSAKIGYLASWGTFFANHATSDYDYTQYRYAYGSGLDCSGYIAWVVYNTLYSKNDQADIVTTSSVIASTYIENGWSYEDRANYYPGDIVSMNGHVWMCLGKCSDGSILLVHTSPKGTQISGTAGKAVELASYYMKKYFSSWPYAVRTVGTSYLNYINKATWYTDGKGVLTDPDGLKSASAENVMRFILGS